jgi:hypothetical protein
MGSFDLEVVEVGADHLTLQTRGDHPEAGRVTLSTESETPGQVRVFVRTRTRANGWRNRLLLRAGGELLQGRLWQVFLERLASRAGSQVVDGVHARSARADDEPADVRPLPIAVGPLQEVR